MTQVNRSVSVLHNDLENYERMLLLSDKSDQNYVIQLNASSISDNNQNPTSRGYKKHFFERESWFY